jgi:hypothetical protein
MCRHALEFESTCKLSSRGCTENLLLQIKVKLLKMRAQLALTIFIAVFACPATADNDAERRALEAERRAIEAERRALDAERRANEAERRTQGSQINSQADRQRQACQAAIANHQTQCGTRGNNPFYEGMKCSEAERFVKQYCYGQQ